MFNIMAAILGAGGQAAPASITKASPKKHKALAIIGNKIVFFFLFSLVRIFYNPKMFLQTTPLFDWWTSKLCMIQFSSSQLMLALKPCLSLHPSLHPRTLEHSGGGGAWITFKSLPHTSPDFRQNSKKTLKSVFIMPPMCFLVLWFRRMMLLIQFSHDGFLNASFDHIMCFLQTLI